ncbi:hypothetical protein DMC30DRAFT_397642 [Rhodotorula diobovata]|uniref:Uncharacterized protein n=1 Tax=Rhodotorula diobovata TaxID=5288 RepID=A0A5C5FVS7_9BASI|nr:hypothetical protein DMC30DRAFT_397642 [Rhodotorula diobovata]
MSPALYPLLPPLVSLRLSLPPFDTVDLTDLVVIAGLRRLTLHGCKVSASDPDRYPLDLVELELLGLAIDPSLVAALISNNSRLETVLLTPLKDPGSRDVHIPGDALATLEHLRFLQYGPYLYHDKVAYPELIAPFVPQVASSLVFVFKTDLAEAWAVPERVRRLIVVLDDEELWRRDYGLCPVRDRLADLAASISQADEVEVVALPLRWHPGQDTSNEREVELGARLGFNTITDACDAQGVELVWWGGSKREGAMPLCDEVRSGWSRALPPSADTREWRTPLEWPGSWDAVFSWATRSEWYEEWSENGDQKGEGSEEDEEDGEQAGESEEVDGDEEGAAGEREEDADL